MPYECSYSVLPGVCADASTAQSFIELQMRFAAVIHIFLRSQSITIVAVTATALENITTTAAPQRNAPPVVAAFHDSLSVGFHSMSDERLASLTPTEALRRFEGASAATRLEYARVHAGRLFAGEIGL